MRIIGITGGIGSGKTTVCKLFECLDVPVFYSDDVAKELMVSDKSVTSKILNTFGKDSYIDGALNRPHLASIVFDSPDKLKQLNAIVHPAVGRATLEWVKSNQGARYGLKEAAILFESGSYRHVEKVITVWAPQVLRIQRVMKRDGSAPEAIERRIDNQISETLRLSLSDYVIENDGQQMLIPQVVRLDGLIRKL